MSPEVQPLSLESELWVMLAPLVPGSTFEGLRLERLSTELGVRLVFRDPDTGARLHVEIAPRDAREKHAALTAQLGLSYRDGPLGERGLAVCRALAEHIRPGEARFVAAVASLGGGGERVREVQVEHLLEPADGFDGLSPYVGCVIGCRFCYAQSHLAGLRALLGHADVPWGSWVDVRVNAPEVLAAELHARDPARPIKFSPVVSDPYQALERRHRITRGCLEALRDTSRTPPVLLLTRGAAARDDLALMAEVGVRLGVSLPTSNDEVRRHFEPRGAPIEARLALLADARAAGVRTFAVAQPMLEGDREALADMLAAHAQSVSIDVLRGEQGAGGDFDDPRFAHTREARWQQDAATELAAALDARGVPRWSGELPPDLRPEEASKESLDASDA